MDREFTAFESMIPRIYRYQKHGGKKKNKYDASHVDLDLAFPTWSILADKIVLHVASVIIPLIEITPSQARIGCWLVIHHYASFTSTGWLICIPISDARYRENKTYIENLDCYSCTFILLQNSETPSIHSLNKRPKYQELLKLSVDIQKFVRYSYVWNSM